MSEHPYVSSDLFHVSLSKLRAVVYREVIKANADKRSDWKWIDSPDFSGFLEELVRLSETERLSVYTRANYVKFCRMMVHIHANHDDILAEMPQWGFLATELHCRVLEREIVEAVQPWDAQQVNVDLHALLCRMRQGI